MSPDRVYRLLLLAYPADHRAEWGEPMVQLARDRFRDEGGGWRSALLWTRLLGDLIRAAFSERLETTMTAWKREWWTFGAAYVGLALGVLGIGNLFDPTDTGPLYGKIVAALIGLGSFAAIVTGLRLRRNARSKGSYLVGIGALPGSLLVIMIWWPPVALTGILALVVALLAIVDGGRASAPQPAD